MKRDSLVSFDLIRVVGQPINSGTDINVIAEAAGSCLSYDPLFEGKKKKQSCVCVGGGLSTITICWGGANEEVHKTVFA